jgi:phage gp46-like protein
MDPRLKYKPETGEFDLDIKRWDIENDDGLETAVLRSLFEDARIETEELPPGEKSLGGFWGDAVENDDNIPSGSKLWLLNRGKLTDETLEQAREYSEQALQWLVDDGVAESVTVTTERINLNTLGIGIEIQRPGEDRKSSRFDFVWEIKANAV